MIWLHTYDHPGVERLIGRLGDNRLVLDRPAGSAQWRAELLRPHGFGYISVRRTTLVAEDHLSVVQPALAWAERRESEEVAHAV